MLIVLTGCVRLNSKQELLQWLGESISSNFIHLVMTGKDTEKFARRISITASILDRKIHVSIHKQFKFIVAAESGYLRPISAQCKKPVTLITKHDWM